MLVCGQDFTDQVIRKIRDKLESEPTISRRALSLKVCQWLDWKDPLGKLKEMSCRVALLKLHRKGIINLPECPVKDWFEPKGEREPIKVESDPICCDFKELGEVELIRIGNRQSQASRIWKALMERHHYLGAGPLCGAQMRYLIKSSGYGWLGGLSFSGAAWRIEERDRWIGWSEEARRTNLMKVVCNSRFLILPWVKVNNLASHVLSMAAKRVPEDWLKRYGFEPVLLETFVEQERFLGTCYRAANWQYVGSTCGRGRQDRERSQSVPVKDIYLFPLTKEAKAVLSGEPIGEVRRPEAREGLSWAEEEFGRSDLGDRRLTKRLVSLVNDFYARPQGSIAQACQSRSKTKAAYRFFDHPDINRDKVLEEHYEATVGRVSQESVVLAVQDTTTLNYTAHPATENLGPIGYRLDRGLGLLLHETMAFNPEGTPLGLLDVQCWARDAADYGKKKRRHEVPIEEKESQKWLNSFKKVVEAQKRCPQTTLVSVGDREADIYELFELALKEPKLLVRAGQDRILAEGQGHLWEKVIGQEIAGFQEIKVPRRKNRPSRIAKLAVRFAEVRLKPPKRKARLQELTLWAVLAQEIDGPADEAEPIEWMLLTTFKVETFEQAVEKLAWYTIRWGIEVYHRTLKSGCKIEERQLGQASRIETCLAIDMVVAWRIFYLTKLGRETPEVPCTVFFEEAEWKALTAYITKNPLPPDQPPPLGQAIRMVASLGGFLGRKGDGQPGTKSLWIGLQRLDDLTAMWKVLVDFFVPHPQ